jgi:hypothetical protein
MNAFLQQSETAALANGRYGVTDFIGIFPMEGVGVTSGQDWIMREVVRL